MRKLLFFLGTIALFIGTSCVPTKKITYLQESDQVKNDSLILIQKVQSPYRLQMNDILSIQIKAPYDSEIVDMFNVASAGGNANGQGAQAGQGGQGAGLYFTGYTVDQHGDIRVPQLGKIQALGLTLEELRLHIEKRLLTEFFKDNADLFVTVRLGGLRYVMAGEVNGTGEQTIFRDQVTIVEAVANSGGIPITGDLSNVRIVRQYPDGVKVHHLDLTQLDVIYSPYYYIQPNDMIVVDPLPQKSLGTGTTGLASFTTIISVVTTLVTTVLLFTRL